MTDYWLPALKLLPAPAAGRWHPELRQARVMKLNWRGLAHDGLAGPGKRRDWNLIQARNAWFQRQHLKALRRDRARLQLLPAGVFFAYSYAARALLEFFRDLGWKTLLGQIDPGPREAEIVAQEMARGNYYQSRWSPPPASYWETLQAEQELADRIIVNSAWSRRLCLEAGVREEKIRVLPLAYTASKPVTGRPPPARHYPDRYSQKRPLRVLFLGQLTLRKGIHYLLESIRELAGEAIEFWFVGTGDLRIGGELRHHPRIVWAGPVSQAQVAHYYARADVFILPTLSDGFALTQLEAQARQLPVITTRHCGDVVRDGENGLIIEPFSAARISDALRRCLSEPGLLPRLSQASRVADEFSLDTLARRLAALETD